MGYISESRRLRALACAAVSAALITVPCAAWADDGESTSATYTYTFNDEQSKYFPTSTAKPTSVTLDGWTIFSVDDTTNASSTSYTCWTTYYYYPSAGTTGNVITVSGVKWSSENMYSTYTDSDGNTVTLDKSYYYFYKLTGGYSDSDTVSGNSVTVENSTSILVDYYGGYSASGEVSGNTLTVTKSNIAGITDSSTGYSVAYLVGGYSGSGNATGNSVSISDSELVNETVIGGYSSSGNAEKNTVTLTDTAGYSFDVSGSAGVTIYGGLAEGDNGQANYNTVTVTNYGADSAVTASDSSFGVAQNTDTSTTIYGGNGKNGATYNKVTVSDSTTKGIYGGYSVYGDASHNEVYLYGTSTSTSGAVYGGNVVGDKSYSYTADASYNTVVIAASTTENEDGTTTTTGSKVYNVYGGASNTGGASYNSVTVSDSTVTGYYVLGGYGTGDTIGNEVTVSNSSVTGYYGVIGGWTYGVSKYAVSGDAKDNTVTVKDGSTVSSVFGGFSSDNTDNSTVSGNAVYFSDSTSTYAIYGGYAEDSDGSTVSGNYVSITGNSYVYLYLYSSNYVYYSQVLGGANYSKGGSASNNTVYINTSTGTFTDDDNKTWNYGVYWYVYGAEAFGDATYNTVTIEGGYVSADVYGGFSYCGDASYNTVALLGGTVVGYVTGGLTYGDTDDDGNVYGSATGNTIIVNGEADLTQALLYGYDTYTTYYLSDTSSLDFSGNTLEVTDGDNVAYYAANFETVQFDRLGNSSDTISMIATNGASNITEVTVCADVSSLDYTAVDAAEGERVELGFVTVSDNIFDLVAETDDDGEVTGVNASATFYKTVATTTTETVTDDDGNETETEVTTYTQEAATDEWFASAAEDYVFVNELALDGDSIEMDYDTDGTEITVGETTYSDTSDIGFFAYVKLSAIAGAFIDEEGNVTLPTSGNGYSLTVDSSLNSAKSSIFAGAFALGDNDVSGASVTLTSSYTGTYTETDDDGNETTAENAKTVYAGYSESGSVTESSVILEEDAASNADVYAYNVGASGSENTIAVYGGNTVNSVNGFDIAEFYNAAANEETAMLTVTNSGTTSDMSVASYAVTLASGESLEGGDYIYLVSGDVTGDTETFTSTAEIAEGIGVDMTATVVGTTDSVYVYISDEDAEVDVGDDETVTVEATTARASAQTKTITQSRLASAALVVDGTDLALDALSGLAMTDDAEKGLQTFAAVEGNDSRYDTGSHVDINSWHVIAGVGRKKELDEGNFAWAAFVESGTGSYKSYSGEYIGSGESDYVGAGLMARYTQDDGLYYEGSFRAGTLDNELSECLVDRSNGKRYGFHTDTPYKGFHAGLGKLFPVGGGTLDAYAKYMYLHVDSDDFRIANEEFTLDGFDSSILRVGLRYNAPKNDDWQVYYGLAWEYEFDGLAAGFSSGYYMPESDMGGSSVMGELGIRYTGAGDWTFDTVLRGYAGTREGISGRFRATYTF